MFVVTGFINILIKSMTEFFPRSIAQLSEGLVSVKRIQVGTITANTELLMCRLSMR